MTGKDVVFQCHSLCSSIGAEFTGKGLFSCMCPHVCLQVGLGGGAVWAVGAGVGLLSRMSPNMSVQIGLHVSGVEAVCAMKSFPGNG